MIGNDSVPTEQGRVAREIVRQALANLPGHQRALLMLVCVDRMTYKQTAKRLDIAGGTVAAQVARARQALDEQITLLSRPDVGRATIQRGRTRGDAEAGGHSC